MTARNQRRSFLGDTTAITGFTIFQILLLLIVPIILFVFWYQYLRRIANDEEAKNGPFGAKKPQAQAASLGDQKRTCGRCGLTVRPSRSAGPPTCPNCMNVL